MKVGLLASVREVVMTKRKSDTGKIFTVKEFRNYFMTMKVQKMEGWRLIQIRKQHDSLLRHGKVLVCILSFMKERRKVQTTFDNFLSQFLFVR